MIRTSIFAAAVAGLIAGIPAVYADDFGIQIGYNGSWAQGGAYYNNSMPYQHVLESPNIDDFSKVHAPTSDQYWGVRSVDGSAQSFGGGSNLVVFPAQGGDTMMTFNSYGSAQMHVSGTVGALHGSASATAWSTPGSYSYINKSGQAAQYNSTLGASAEAQYSARWTDSVSINAGAAGAMMRAEIQLDSNLSGGPGANAWAQTQLSIIIERAGQYYTMPYLTMSDSLLAGSDPTSGPQSTHLDIWVLTGDTLWITQELTGGAGATADYTNGYSSATSDASHTALFRLYGIPETPGGEVPNVIATSASGADYTDYVTAVPEPASLAMLGLGAAALLKRRK